MPVSIENKKIELIQWLSTLEDQSLIDKLLKYVLTRTISLGLGIGDG